MKSTYIFCSLTFAVGLLFYFISFQSSFTLQQAYYIWQSDNPVDTFFEPENKRLGTDIINKNIYENIAEQLKKTNKDRVTINTLVAINIQLLKRVSTEIIKEVENKVKMEFANNRLAYKNRYSVYDANHSTNLLDNAPKFLDNTPQESQQLSKYVYYSQIANDLISRLSDDEAKIFFENQAVSNGCHYFRIVYYSDKVLPEFISRCPLKIST